MSRCWCAGPTGRAGKVRHETLANLSALPAEAVAAVEATLKGERLVPAGQAVTIAASLPHGHVAAVHAMAAKLGLPALLGPAGRAAGPGPGPGHLPGGRPGLEAGHPDLVGRHHAGRRPGRGRRRPPMTSTRRWTGWRTGRTRSRRHWRPGTWPRRRTRRGWRCSTCHRRGWKARTARWRPAATPATARRASCRSSTGCSPTPRAGPSRSGSSTATPPTRPRSPRSSRCCGRSSPWRRWSWSATGA